MSNDMQSKGFPSSFSHMNQRKRWLSQRNMNVLHVAYIY